MSENTKWLILFSLPIAYVVLGIVFHAMVAVIEKPLLSLWKAAGLDCKEKKIRTKEQEDSLRTEMFWAWLPFFVCILIGTAIALAIVLPRWYIGWLESKPWRCVKNDDEEIVEKKPSLADNRWG